MFTLGIQAIILASVIIVWDPDVMCEGIDNLILSHLVIKQRGSEKFLALVFQANNMPRCIV